MKKFVKVVCLTMVVAMLAVAFTACGSKNYAKNNTEFFIGATGPLTGDASSYGISVNNGAKLAVKELNANGGINGVQVKYEMVDDQCDATKATNGFNTLYEKGMQASIGSVTSGACEAFGQKADEKGLFFLTPSASDPNVIADRDAAFRVCFGDPDQGVMAADKIAADGYTKVGVIYDTSSDYSTGIYEAFIAQMKKLGKDSIVTVKTFNSDAGENKDFSAQVEALKTSDVIFMPFYYTEAALVAETCKTKGCNAVLFGCDGFDGILAKLTDTASGNLTVTNEIYYITPFDVKSTDATVKSFVDAYKAEYGEEPDQFAADGYDAVMAIAQAMKNANVTDPTTSAADLGKVLVEQFTASTFKYTGATGAMTWNVAGEPTKIPNIVALNKKN